MSDIIKIIGFLEALKVLLPLIMEILNMISDSTKKKEAETLIAKSITDSLRNIIIA